MKRLEFQYDARGRGDLTLYKDDKPIDRYHCRTGSINKHGALVNALKIGDYWLTDASVDTAETAMSIAPGMNGWKIRLWLKDEKGKLVFTHLLIHPDGGAGGTLGCIGIEGTNAVSFRHELDAAVKEQGRVLVKVGTTNWL
jgi:hypothetical protein